jgi:hypothetical protein
VARVLQKSCAAGALALLGGACAGPPLQVHADLDPAHGALHREDARLHKLAGPRLRQSLQISGPWQVAGEGFMTPALAQASDRDPSGLDDPGHGYLRLSTVRDGARTLSSEVMSDGDPGPGPGYYETRMVVDPEHRAGGALSFFWIEAHDPTGPGLTGAGYGPREIDIEFLANEDWATHPDQPGYVHFTLHPAKVSWRQPLPFNPSTGYHRYGFLWIGAKVVFTVDGAPVHTLTDPALAMPPRHGGWIMANVWSGIPTWGGPSPAQPVSAVYNRIDYRGGATRIIAAGAPVRHRYKDRATALDLAGHRA